MNVNVNFTDRLNTIFSDKAMPFMFRFQVYLEFEVEFLNKGYCKKIMNEGMQLVFKTAFNNYMEMIAVANEYIMQYGKRSKSTSYYKFMLDQIEIHKQVMLN